MTFGPVDSIKDLRRQVESMALECHQEEEEEEEEEGGEKEEEEEEEGTNKDRNCMR